MEYALDWFILREIPMGISLDEFIFFLYRVLKYFYMTSSLRKEQLLLDPLTLLLPLEIELCLTHAVKEGVGFIPFLPRLLICSHMLLKI